jgi:DNA-binding NarL/FixJ family response regulator
MRVVIADDVLLVRAGEAQLLRSVGIEVVAECADADELLRAVALESPDAAIIDIRMPPTHTDEGLVAAQRIRRLHPSTAVLVLSQYLEPAYASRLLADEPAMTGYLLKERVLDVTVLVDALEAVVAGSCIIDDAIVGRLVDRRRGAAGHDPLTDREAEVLELIAAGRSNTAIADQLCISPKTVEALVTAVFRKLGLEASPTSNRRVLAVLSVLARTEG